MIKGIVALVKGGLTLVGAISLAGGLILIGTISYHLGPGNISSSATSSKHDVRHVLNQCGLGEHRIEEVVQSFHSGYSFGGSHYETEAIKISDVSAAELKGGNWFRGDQVEGILKDAVEFCVLSSRLHDITGWKPVKAEVFSSEIYVYPWTIYTEGLDPIAAQLILVRPKDNMVFYINSAL